MAALGRLATWQSGAWTVARNHRRLSEITSKMEAKLGAGDASVVRERMSLRIRNCTVRLLTFAKPQEVILFQVFKLDFFDELESSSLNLALEGRLIRSNVPQDEFT